MTREQLLYRVQETESKLREFARAVKRYRDLVEIAKRNPECVNANDLEAAQFDVDMMAFLYSPVSEALKPKPEQPR